MASAPIDQLTEAQRECLRLVLTHHNSKEIAARLGLSPSAVDKRVERAVQTLGVNSRFAAARMLAAAEGSEAYDRLPSETIDVPDTVPARPEPVPGGPRWIARRLLGLPSGTDAGGRRRNDLGGLQRLGVIVALMFLIAMTSMALLNLGQTLSFMLSGGRAQ